MAAFHVMHDARQNAYPAYDPTVNGHPANKVVTLRKTTPVG